MPSQRAKAFRLRNWWAQPPITPPRPIPSRPTLPRSAWTPKTGQITVLQVVPVHEIGKVIHPIAAAGQIEGGIQQGIGHTLYEDYQIDMSTGRSLNANFVDYKMPLSMDMPQIRTVLLETAPDPGGPYGAKGVGEDPIIAIGPAIVNAVYDAIGVRFRHYPIRPEQVLQALKARTAQGHRVTEGAYT